MAIEMWPTLRLAVSMCSMRGCEKVIPKGTFYCTEHAGNLHLFKQSEPVDPRLAKRNAMVASGQCYVYAVAGGEFVKFGKALDVESRFRGLQTGSPVELALLGAVLGPKTLEKSIHAWAQPARVRGEWFSRMGRIEAMVGLIVAGDLSGIMDAMKKPLDSESN